MDFNLFCVLPTITDILLVLKMSHIWPVGSLLAWGMMSASLPLAQEVPGSFCIFPVSDVEPLPYFYIYHIFFPFSKLGCSSPIWSFWNQILKTKGAFILTQHTWCLTHFCAAALLDSRSENSQLPCLEYSSRKMVLSLKRALTPSSLTLTSG